MPSGGQSNGSLSYTAVNKAGDTGVGPLSLSGMLTTLGGITSTVSLGVAGSGSSFTASYSATSGGCVGASFASFILPLAPSTAQTTGFSAIAGLDGSTLTANIPTGGLVGAQGIARVYTGTLTGSVISSTGILGQIQNQNAGVTMANAFAMYVSTPVATGPITTNYGLFIADQRPANITSSFALAIAAQGAGGYAIWCQGSGRVLIQDPTDSTTAATGAVLLTGGLGVGKSIHAGGTIATAVYTVAALPAGAASRRAYVSDALAPAFGAAVVGGGAVGVPVYHDGISWKVG